MLFIIDTFPLAKIVSNCLSPFGHPIGLLCVCFSFNVILFLDLLSVKPNNFCSFDMFKRCALFTSDDLATLTYLI